MFRKIFGFLLVLFAAGAFASDGLVSNFTFAAGPGPSTGSFWVVCRGTTGSGLSLVNLSIANRVVSATSITQEILADSISPVQDGVFSDVTAEHRRTPFVNAKSLGLVLPLFVDRDSAGGYLVPQGYLSARATNAVSARALPNPESSFEGDTAMLHASSAFVYDSSDRNLWIARGTYGVTIENVSKGINSPVRSFYAVNAKTLSFDTLSASYEATRSKNPAVFGLASESSEKMWVATDSGLFILNPLTWKLSRSGVTGLDTSRVTGVWIGGTPTQIIVETSKRYGNSTEDKLWRSYNGGKFAEVVFRDTTGKVQKNIYDKADYSISNAAFVGKTAFLSVQAVEGSESGLLKLDSAGAVPWDNENQWLYGFDAGVVERNVVITSVVAFPLSSSVMALAVCTYGSGVSVSADTGKTWTSIVNQTAVKDDLGSIRMVPSVISADDQSLVSYKVSKPSKITIEVFSYDMRKVRTIVKDADRQASVTRSTKASEDYWDGRDNGGRAVAMGIYYIRVKDNHGHVGWGKAITLGGK